MVIAEVDSLLRSSVANSVPILVEFLRQEVRKTGFENVVFGLSGGIDSAVVAYLAVQAFGSDHVFGLIMPYKTSSKASVDDALKVVNDLGLSAKQVDISPQIDAYFAQVHTTAPLRRGNKMARERMSIIYDHSVEYRALALGTSNKTELLLGYGTQFGDLASAVNPIGDLYKTQIREVARLVGVPQSILDKAPSADLWEDQTDETELGFSYEEADTILHLLIDDRLSLEEVCAYGFKPALVETIMRRVQQNQYKRRMPVIAKLSSRTIGIDFRYPRDWGM